MAFTSVFGLCFVSVFLIKFKLNHLSPSRGLLVNGIVMNLGLHDLKNKFLLNVCHICSKFYIIITYVFLFQKLFINMLFRHAMFGRSISRTGRLMFRHDLENKAISFLKRLKFFKQPNLVPLDQELVSKGRVKKIKLVLTSIMLRPV